MYFPDRNEHQSIFFAALLEILREKCTAQLQAQISQLDYVNMERETLTGFWCGKLTRKKETGGV